MTFLNRVIMQLIAFAFLGVVVFEFGVFDYSTRQFQDTKQFVTYQDAQVFEAQVVQEAQAVKATEINTTISISSPPTLSYTITVPATGPEFLMLTLPKHYSFVYGSEMSGPVAVWVSFGVFAPICLGLFGIVSWLAWHEKEEEK